MMLQVAGFRGFAAAAALAAGNCTQEAGGGARPPSPAATLPAAERPAAAPVPRPNLVLLTIDTLRADHLSCYGHFRKTSPFIDALAAESLLFERCYATIPHTTPSHASILTGVLPLEHGITQNTWLATSEQKRAAALVTTPQLQSYAQILKKHGWATGGFVSAATAARVTGLAAGFDAWSEPEADRRPGRETLDDAKAWLAGTADRPFFLWIHLFDVHGPHKKDDPWEAYAADFPEDDAQREELARRGIKAAFEGRGGGQIRPIRFNVRYDASIRFTDDLVAELVAALRATGAWERTTFVLTSDHGEGLGEHDAIGHELTWGEQLRVPLIVRAPGRAGERLPQVMSGIDVLPTAVHLTPGLPHEELHAQASGRSATADAFEELPVFSIAPREREFAVTLPRWKLVRRVEGGDALYDLADDPHELHDVKDEQPRIAAALAAQLEASLAEQERRRDWLRAGGVEPERSREAEQRHREMLRALGYVEER